MTEYQTPLCRLRCDRQGFALAVGELEIQGDRARLRRWYRAVTQYVEGLVQGSELVTVHRVTVDGETYVLSTLQMFDLFTALAQAEPEMQTAVAPLPLVGLLGAMGFAMGAVLTFGLLPRSPAVEVAQHRTVPPFLVDPPQEKQTPATANELALPPAAARKAKTTGAEPSLPPPTPIRVTPRAPAPPTLEEAPDRPRPLSLPVAELPIAPEPVPLAARRAEVADPTPALQAHLRSLQTAGRTVLRLAWQPNQPPVITVESTTLSSAAIAQLRRQIEDWSRQNPSLYQGITRLTLAAPNDLEPASGATTAPVSPPRSSDLLETPPPGPAAN